MRNYYDLERSDFEALCKAEGWPSFRAKQLFEWQSKGFDRFDDLNNLPLAMRERLKALLSQGQFSVIEAVHSKASHSDKYVLSLGQGEVLEAVLMRHSYGNSLCLSTQSGCRMGCRFCASGYAPFGRQLSTGELLEQFLLVSRRSEGRISHLDLMGVGEPLDNYDAVLRFIRRIGDPSHVNLSLRHVCLSTCGLVPQMEALANEGLPVTLSVSLHAPNQSIRERLMPIAKRYAIEEVLAAAKLYFQKTGRRVSYEYALFQGVNDLPEHARELSILLKGQNCHVNLIPGNAVEGTGLKTSSPAFVQGFLKILKDRHIPATLRKSFGGDINAACGQLRRRRLLARNED